MWGLTSVASLDDYNNKRITILGPDRPGVTLATYPQRFLVGARLPVISKALSRCYVYNRILIKLATGYIRLGILLATTASAFN